ncbi:MAG: DUF3883 domain-containing protein [Flavobacteriales bacterium]|nr:DUF3883 domain-containing protein [Flavobacteriales bacterium]MCW8913933.1 DUF3883 domain-containing protein [Flavobacteriales bacterium]MCW8937267.1 DUF3883 domain-containing protein [Flavobacteriales bacterium]MCW8939428.1 DUF3883 domain-containing protein [Flavobacteriales bacterium]MCW8967217.1 DUF3883 domain-containing protein [Flavobacteriales bacterium]
MNKKTKAILTGLFLSKYNEEALKILDFNSFNEAFNVLGISLSIKPSSIKNYRDEFDPYFPNKRKGWHKRPMRDNCYKLYNSFKDLDFTTFSDLIKSFFIDNYEIENFILKLQQTKSSSEESFAKRLLTGKAAEEYFKIEYNKIDVFKSFNLTDTTLLGCGFDFKLSFMSDFYCIEVKGLREAKGNIQMTEKEFETAKMMKSQYCLFIVKNFKEKPMHEYVFDPLNSRLKFKKVKTQIIQTSYSSII